MLKYEKILEIQHALLHFPLGTHMWVNHNLIMFVAVIVVKCVHLKHVDEIMMDMVC